MAGMSRYIVARSIQMVITLLIILTIIFIMFESLPSRPQDLLAMNPNILPSQREYVEELFGFDRPVLERYFLFMKNMLTFDFGISFSSAEPVWSLLEDRIPRTMLLFGLSTILAYIIGIYLGALIAWRRGGILDGSSVVVSLTFYNMPSFWIGLIFLVVFASELRWFPLTGWYDPTNIRGGILRVQGTGHRVASDPASDRTVAAAVGGNGPAHEDGDAGRYWGELHDHGQSHRPA